MKELVVFDLDGTLAESKSALDPEMGAWLRALLEVVKVAVISGGDWPQFESQLLRGLPADAVLENLLLLPTSGTKFFAYESGWKRIYADDFSDAEKEKIIAALEQVTSAPEFSVQTTWGERIEDRGSQITFSALGQQAPLEAKKAWDPDFEKRQRMKPLIERLIPEFSVRLGGSTSVDVTKPGIDKAYGIRKLRDILEIATTDMIFVGDALFPGGNDYPARETGAVCIEVKGPEETKLVIETIVACGEQRGSPAV
jgi:HAD superfamily hydrolase (TIGR01484 family)